MVLRVLLHGATQMTAAIACTGPQSRSAAREVRQGERVRRWHEMCDLEAIARGRAERGRPRTHGVQVRSQATPAGPGDATEAAR